MKQRTKSVSAVKDNGGWLDRRRFVTLAGAAAGAATQFGPSAVSAQDAEVALLGPGGYDAPVRGSLLLRLFRGLSSCGVLKIHRGNAWFVHSIGQAGARCAKIWISGARIIRLGDLFAATDADTRFHSGLSG